MRRIADAGSIRFSRAHRTDQWAERRKAQRYFLSLIEARAPHLMEAIVSPNHIHLYRVAVNYHDRQGEEMAFPHDRVTLLGEGRARHSPEHRELLYSLLEMTKPMGLNRWWFVIDALYTIDRVSGLPGWWSPLVTTALSQMALPIDRPEAVSFPDHDMYTEWLRQWESDRHTVRIELEWATRLESWDTLFSRAKAALNEERTRIEAEVEQPKPWLDDLRAEAPTILAQFDPIRPASRSAEHFDWLFRHQILGHSADRIARDNLGEPYDDDRVADLKALIAQRKTVSGQLKTMADLVGVTRRDARPRGRPVGALTRNRTGLDVRRSGNSR